MAGQNQQFVPRYRGGDELRLHTFCVEHGAFADWLCDETHAAACRGFFVYFDLESVLSKDIEVLERN